MKTNQNRRNKKTKDNNKRQKIENTKDKRQQPKIKDHKIHKNIEKQI